MKPKLRTTENEPLMGEELDEELVRRVQRGVVLRDVNLFAELARDAKRTGAAVAERLDVRITHAQPVDRAAQLLDLRFGQRLDRELLELLADLRFGSKIVFVAAAGFDRALHFLAAVQMHFDAHEMWKAVEEVGVTQMAIVGDAFGKPMVRALEEAEDDSSPYDLSSLTMIVSSGVMWTAPVKEALMERGNFICLDSLGSSEGAGFANQVSVKGAKATTARFSIGANTKVFTEDGTEVVIAMMARAEAFAEAAMFGSGVHGWSWDAAPHGRVTAFHPS